MMPDSPHTSATIFMRDGHPSAARFPPHRSRPAGYQPNRQPATVGAEERGGRGTTSSRTTTRAAPKLSPPKSACAGDAVLRTSTRGTVPMGQCAGCHRGHDARVAHGSERRRSHFLGDCWGHKIRRDRSGSQFGHRLYPTPQLRRTVKSPPDSTFDTIHAKSGSGERLGRTV